MRLTRVYVDAPLLAGERRVAGSGAANHIVRVLRLRVGDPLTLFDGEGGEYDATIEEIHRDVVSLNVREHRAVERESPLALTLAQGISRGERMDWVIQKATELGASRIAPLFTERSVVRLDAQQAQKKLQHWRSIAIAACEQCGRNRIPQIDAPRGLFEFLEHGAREHSRLLLSPLASLRVSDVPGLETGAVVLIGPEGGLDDTEQEAALARGFTAVRLGPRVLRTETAAVAALSLLQQRFGDL
jgi:16S rRNA (uracil1498-N3)-methyltransferase